MEYTRAGFVAHVRAQIGQLYWYGTFGQAPTQGLLDQKAQQYPKYMTQERYDYAKRHHVGKQKRCFDCAGLIKSYWMMEHPTAQPVYRSQYDQSAAGLRAACSTGGVISTLPEEAGLLLFIGDSHVGVYLGQGLVVEARGFSYGVVLTNAKDRKFDHWGRLKWLPTSMAETQENQKNQVTSKKEN